MIKAFSSSDSTHELHIYTEEGHFIGTSNLRNVGNKYLEVDGPVARRGYGKHLYDFMAMYARENNKKIISSMDGDTREGGVKNWQRIYNDSSFNKEIIPEEYRLSLYEWTNEEETPFLFHASCLEPSSVYLDNKLDNSDVTHFLKFSELKEKYNDVFGITYNSKNNEWIEDEYPASAMKLNELFKESNKLTIKTRNKLKN